MRPAVADVSRDGGLAPVGTIVLEFELERVATQWRGLENAMYTDRKAAQIAGYFLAKGGQRMAYLKLIKLMYLADREAMLRFGRPISDDLHCSMPHGPVLSRTLNLLDGQRESDEWSQWIRAVEDYDVALVKDATNRDVFDEISNADMAVLDAVWTRFGRMNKWELRDWTHHNCAEWVDPNGSSRTISSDAIFRAVGRTAAEAQELASELTVSQRLDRILESVR